MSSNVFQIENGRFALALVGEADPDDWQAPGGETVDTVTTADYETAGGAAFTCQITSGALSASANTSTDTTPATFCGPEETVTKVGVTSYSMDITALQDPHIVNGLNRYLFENDTKLAYGFIGFDGDNPPRAIGRVRLISGTIGGDARTRLTFTLSLPMEHKPDIEFGDATDSEVVTGGAGSEAATVATAGTPGSFNGAAPANFAALTASAIAASPNTAWTTGQWIDLGDASDAYWSGSAWVVGTAP